MISTCLRGAYRNRVVGFSIPGGAYRVLRIRIGFKKKSIWIRLAFNADPFRIQLFTSVSSTCSPACNILSRTERFSLTLTTIYALIFMFARVILVRSSGRIAGSSFMSEFSALGLLRIRRTSRILHSTCKRETIISTVFWLLNDRLSLRLMLMYLQ